MSTILRPLYPVRPLLRKNADQLGLFGGIEPVKATAKAKARQKLYGGTAAPVVPKPKTAPKPMAVPGKKPKEGDTRTNRAGNKEVLRSGRWRLADNPQVVAKEPPAAIVPVVEDIQEQDLVDESLPDVPMADSEEVQVDEADQAIDKITNAARSISEAQQNLKNRAMIYQVEAKERLAMQRGLPLNAYYELNYQEWMDVQDQPEALPQAEPEPMLEEVLEDEGMEDESEVMPEVEAEEELTQQERWEAIENIKGRDAASLRLYKDKLRAMSPEESKAYLKWKDKKAKSESSKRAASKRQQRKKASDADRELKMQTPEGRLMLEVQDENEKRQAQYKKTGWMEGMLPIEYGGSIKDSDPAAIKEIKLKNQKQEAKQDRASHAWRVRQMADNPHVSDIDYNSDQWSDLSEQLQTGPAPLKAHRQHGIPWKMQVPDADNYERDEIIAGAEIKDDYGGKRYLHISTTAGIAADDYIYWSPTSSGGFRIYFESGDAEQSRRARRLIREMAEGKARHVTLQEIEAIITGKELTHYDKKQSDRIDRGEHYLSINERSQGQESDIPVVQYAPDPTLTKALHSGPYLTLLGVRYVLDSDRGVLRKASMSWEDFRSEAEAMHKEANSDDDPCWKGYEAVGMKRKKGRMVPNCVPVSR